MQPAKRKKSSEGEAGANCEVGKGVEGADGAGEKDVEVANGGEMCRGGRIVEQGTV